jgi:hypothetical protein
MEGKEEDQLPMQKSTETSEWQGTEDDGTEPEQTMTSDINEMDEADWDHMVLWVMKIMLFPLWKILKLLMLSKPARQGGACKVKWPAFSEKVVSEHVSRKSFLYALPLVIPLKEW